MTYFELKDKITTGGRPHKISIEDRLVMTSRYLYENRTYHSISVEYDMADTTALPNIRSIEDVLAK